LQLLEALPRTELFVGFSSTVTQQNKVQGIFYGYTDSNTKGSSAFGAGVHEWLGVGLGASKKGNVFIEAQATPWVQASVSVGFDGVGVSGGIISGNTSKDFEAKAGLGLIVSVAIPFLAPSMTQSVPAYR